MARNYYDILGVSKGASKDEIRRAYRRLAHEYHPDKGGGDEKKFREINEAYEVLSDDNRRAQYDQFGETFEQARARGAGGFGGFGGFEDFSDFVRGFGDNFSRGPFSGIEFDFGDIFSDIFGSPRQKRRGQGVDLETELKIDFLESVAGTEKEIVVEKQDMCPVCEGKGAAAGSKIVACPQCHGTGQIVKHSRTILGSFQQVRTCEECEGTGKVPEKACSECRGSGIKKMRKTIRVSVPAGIEDGQRLKIPQEGEMGYRGSSRGDLYVVMKVHPHPEFKREGFDILSETSVSFYQAALGAQVEINTVDGKGMLKIPAGIQSGQVLRLRGRGVSHPDSRRRGDHLVMIKIVTPTKLSKKEKEFLRQLAGERGEQVEN